MCAGCRTVGVWWGLGCRPRVYVSGGGGILTRAARWAARFRIRTPRHARVDHPRRRGEHLSVEDCQARARGPPWASPVCARARETSTPPCVRCFSIFARTRRPGFPIPGTRRPLFPGIRCFGLPRIRFFGVTREHRFGPLHKRRFGPLHMHRFGLPRIRRFGLKHMLCFGGS